MSLEDKMQDWVAYKDAAQYSKLNPTLNVIDYSDDNKKTIVLMGDEHMGSKFYDEKLHTKNLQWCLDNEIPIILMGDEIDAGTRDSVGASVYEQNEIIDNQIQKLLKKYEPLIKKGLILGKHDGNHEQRVYKKTGLDLNRLICKEMGVKNFEWGKFHYIRVGDQNYSLYTTHGASGARMPHTKIKAAIKLADMADAEIYAMGHVHQLSHHVRNFYSINKRNRTVEESQKHFIITGSYLTYWGSYGNIKNYEPMRKGSPKLKLHGEEHMIRVSL